MMKDELKQVELQLSKVSPTMCLVKWKHATLNLGVNSVKSCCHNLSRKIEFSKDPQRLHDTLTDRQIRKDLLEGKKPAECQYCWSMEETGNYSDRIFWSKHDWMNDYFQEVSNHKSEVALSPSWLELNFSSTCQLKCSYCNPGYSTSWQSEVQEHGPYPTANPHNDLIYFKEQGLLPGESGAEEMDLKATFWVWLESALPKVRLLTLTGGEPLLSRETFRFLDYLLAHPQPQLELAVNSNLCLPEGIWQEFVQKVSQLQSQGCVKSFFLHPSLDSWGRRAEYIRHGLKMEIFLKNLTTFIEKTKANIVFNCTLNNLSLGGLLDFWKFVVELKKAHGSTRWISSTSELLVFPQWQRLNLLPASFVSYLNEVEAYLISEGPFVSDHEIEGIRRAQKFILSKEGLRDTDKSDFLKFFSEHDRRRQTNFRDTFPELVSFYEDCSKAALT